MSFTPLSHCLPLTWDFSPVSTGAELMAISTGNNLRKDRVVLIMQVTRGHGRTEIKLCIWQCSILYDLSWDYSMSKKLQPAVQIWELSGNLSIYISSTGHHQHVVWCLLICQLLFVLCYGFAVSPINLLISQSFFFFFKFLQGIWVVVPGNPTQWQNRVCANNPN